MQESENPLCEHLEAVVVVLALQYSTNTDDGAVGSCQYQHADADSLEIDGECVHAISTHPVHNECVHKVSGHRI